MSETYVSVRAGQLWVQVARSDYGRLYMILAVDGQTCEYRLTAFPGADSNIIGCRGEADADTETWLSSGYVLLADGP